MRASIKSSPVPTEIPGSTDTNKTSLVSDLAVLSKIRLNIFSVFTALVGMLLAARGVVQIELMLFVGLGTLLVGSGAAVFNQIVEIELDRVMKRTLGRPLPSGRVSVQTATILGVASTLGGLAVLSIFTTGAATFFAALSVIIYICVYTPMKRKRSYVTLVGAIAGALPPIVGWMAVEPSASLGAFALFALLFFWQIPHFLAIAWMYRYDYERAGFRMLPVIDRGGEITGRVMMIYTLALIVVSVLPLVLMDGSWWIIASVLVVGSAFTYFTLRFMRERSNTNARRVFLSSLAYLPSVLLLQILQTLLLD